MRVQIVVFDGFDELDAIARWLIERFASAQIATQVESRLEYERRGTVWRR